MQLKQQKISLMRVLPHLLHLHSPITQKLRTGIKSIQNHGNVAKKKRLVPCRYNDPKKRHRCNRDSVNFTTGYIVCWIGILIYYGSLGTTKSPKNLWMHMPYGIYPLGTEFNEKGCLHRM